MHPSQSPARWPGRPGRRARALGVVAAASLLAILGSSLGAAANASPRPERTRQWQRAIERLGVPGRGCFTASYPKLAWLRTPCQTVPDRPYPPARGRQPEVVGNGHDYSAEISGLLTSATGSFDSVSAGATETGQQNGSGPQVPNTFSLQLNAKPFTTSKCSRSPNPGCLGWQQFIYSTTFNDVFMQYWLLQYDTTCPSGWNTFTFPHSTDIYCWKNSGGAGLSGSPVTVGGLTGTSLTGTASSAGHDTVVITTGSGHATATSADSVLHLASGWKGVEFALVGDCCGTRANFSAGTTIKVRTAVHSGTRMAPICVLEGFTGETNNLNLASTPAIGTSASPTIVSKQTSASGSASCGAASGFGDTHLTTFRNLLYDFQASGDFELATTGPAFVVQARQVSGAPTWPNAAVNQALATRIGTSDVAICPAPPSPAGPSYQLKINGKTVKLPSGGHVNLAGGGNVSLTENTYLIVKNGDSVSAQFNLGSPNWINVVVGVGRWPEAVHGLLSNAGNNAHAIESRGGTVLTAPFAFNEFYNVYGKSWRVTAKESLLSVCGGKVASDNPTNLMYASDLKAQLARSARLVCTDAGVKAAPLLDACTVDVAVLGSKAAARIYRSEPTSVIWGKILPPVPNSPAVRR
jgi:hypothetical protein